jgi:hypothetical protein
MGLIRMLRPGHWIALALVVAAIGSGALTGFFGLLGVKPSEAKRLTACLSHRHIDVAAVTTNPAELLSAVGSHGQDKRAVLRLLRHERVQTREARSVIGCLERAAR